MLRRRVGLLLVCCLAGCLWRGYANIMGVHVDVLTEMAAKLCAMAEAGRGVSAEGMGEYIYPAQRARQFLQQFSGQSQRKSYHDFAALVDRYEAMVHDADTARAQGHSWHDELPRLQAARDALRQLGTQIRAELTAGD